jgi:hypothetical protein
MHSFILRLQAGERVIAETACLAAVLENEAYTPYASLTATFLSRGEEIGEIHSVELEYDGTVVFFGIADNVRQYRRNGAVFVHVQSRSFTSVLAQNELVPGLHANLTIDQLLTGFYSFPHVTYQPYSGTGYIYVKDGASMWDSVINYAYKLTGHHPYIRGNRVCLTMPEQCAHVELSPAQVLEWGTTQDTTKFVSTYHMADVSDNYDAYQLENPPAVRAQIVRHKQLLLDKQYLSDPEGALRFRCQFSQRGWRSSYVTYSSYTAEQLCDRVSFGDFMQNACICRIRMVFGSGGIRTTLWTYEDGFYHKS